MKYLLPFFLLTTVSLHAAETNYQAFLDAGGPSVEDPWSGQDYMAATQVFVATQIPTLASKDGKRLFEKFIDTANLAMNRDEKLSIDTRMGDFVAKQQALVLSLNEYLKAANGGQPELHTEVAQMMGYALHLAAVGIDLAEEFLPTIPKDDPTYEVRKEGLQQMYVGLTTMFAGAEYSLSETHFYSKEDLLGLLVAMEATLPKLQRAFTPEYQTELTTSLEKRLTSAKGKEADLFRSMLETLKASGQ